MKNQKILQLEERLINFQKKNNWGKVIETSKKILTLAPEHLLALKTLGKLYVEGDCCQQALPLLEKAVTYSRTDASLLMYLGLAQLDTGDKKTAINTFKKASLFDPKNDKVWVNLGLAYRETHEYDQAIKALENAIKVNPKSCPANLNLGMALLAKNKIADAEAHFLKCLELDEKYLSALNALAVLYEKQERKQQAKDYLQKVITLDKFNADAYTNLAAIYIEEGELELAKKNLDLSIKYAPNSYKSYLNLFSFLGIQGETKQQQLLIATLEEKFSGHPEVILAIIKFIADHIGFEQAINFSEKYLKLDHPLIYSSVGYCYHNLMELDTAAHFYKKSLSIQHSGDLEQALTNVFIESQTIKKYLGDNARLWRGETIEKTDSIIVFRQQGIGDEIFYARYFNYLKNNFSEVSIVVSKKLIPLFSSSFDGITFLEENDSSINTINGLFYSNKAAKQSDIPSSQSHHFYTGGCFLDKFCDQATHFTERGVTPYLKPHPSKAEQWASFFSNYQDKPILGISWRSSNMKEHRKMYYARIEDLQPIWDLQEKFYFVNLQYDECQEELAQIRALGIDIIDPPNINQKEDLEDVVAIMVNMDAVVTPQTSVHILSAASGTKTYTFVPDLKVSRETTKPYNFNNMQFIYRQIKKDKVSWFTEISALLCQDLIK
ncbi:Tetratricopeptide repeat-containing protein [Allopseudospirillum japonicum]|uniref:Tetratricopeptide repeat-containing protein n=1 Tax=Allopseudospirillum japonicum TaxID=64971 RepID=A0A1H6U3L6_9GAMM|nr:tetratricopeptide repeat protein [Allopseudospirillum japonicum]SEI86919.1 Tetratricopeptide repeat-containing protein [Allopseudospirillum japonicum]